MHVKIATLYGLCQLFVIFLTGNEKTCLDNMINMAAVPDITYSTTWLRNFNAMKQGTNIKLASNVYQKIKDLNLLRPDIRTVRGKRAGACKPSNFDIISGVNKSNLTVVNCVETPEIPTSNVIVGCVNVRSIRNKTHDFVDNVLTDDYDICMVTETWLDGADSVPATEATPGGYVFDYQPRQGRTGGGVGLLCKKEFKIIKRHTSRMESFEFC